METDAKYNQIREFLGGESDKGVALMRNAERPDLPQLDDSEKESQSENAQEE